MFSGRQFESDRRCGSIFADSLAGHVVNFNLRPLLRLIDMMAAHTSPEITESALSQRPGALGGLNFKDE